MRQLTIVVPTYNEAENLPALTQALWGLGLVGLRILVVDDDSPDGTGAVADALAAAHPGQVEVIHRKGKLGLGSAYIQGFRRALDLGAQAIGQMDADFSHSPRYLTALLEGLEQADLVLGSRYVQGGGVDENWGVARLALSSFGNWYARTILRLSVRDATGGYRIWRREGLLSMPLDSVRSNGYVFQVEMAYVAQRLGLRTLELPIYFPDRRIGQSKMSFRIQVEAALRVWMLPWLHHSLRATVRPRDTD
ncbi:MAG TPA: polyprenol monophosphomannose synthase [Anaerolineales bacterium]|nr:polyprenol monophosphomannose synthase [Anaerolineales bacterium]